MPRDIRSYFQSAKTNTTKAPLNVASPRTKRRVISSDEDDERKQSPIKRSKKSKISERRSVESDSEKNGNKNKIVSPAAMFGSTPIIRQEAPKILKRAQKQETKTHNDQDFEATLHQLDTSDIEQQYLTETKIDKDSELHENNAKNKEKKKTPVKKKQNIKEKKVPDQVNVKKTGKKDSPNAKKHSNSSSSEDTEQHSKTSKSIFTMEVTYKEKKEVSPKETEAPNAYEERSERRKQRLEMYQQYLQRGGPKNPGSKEIPVGAENCLAGLSFVITGVLDSLEREEAAKIIEQYGGRSVHQVSKKTSYVIVGDQPGPAKIAKAKSLNIPEISEDGLLELIRTRHASQMEINQSRLRANYKKSKQKSTDSEETSQLDDSDVIMIEEIPKETKGRSTKRKEPSVEQTEKSPRKSPRRKESSDKEVEKSQEINKDTPMQTLVDKYKPKSIKQILGQQGDKSNAKKLYNWLLNWHKNHTGKQNQGKHTKSTTWSKSDDGSAFKAALLSGPPGIGKTTTVEVVCNELSLDLLELNASDTRSKKLLQERVSNFLSNTTIKSYFQDINKSPLKQVLLMDEVDGMAGNEDRGGLQEIIAMIKSTDIPIICICNDRYSSKVRTLANYSYDLRFTSPKLLQIRAAMKSICFKENIDISNEDLDRLIESTNLDIRQVLNHLSLYVGQAAAPQSKSNKKHVNKDVKLGPWDVVRQVFSAEEQKNMNYYDKNNLFFQDYNIGPLFVQENYLRVVPQAPKGELLERIAQSAESIALGDIVENQMRSSNLWSLLPIQACFSSVIPGTIMSGHIDRQVTFPEWLGRKSKAGKVDRLLQEITVHTHLATGASKDAINLDYIKPLRNAILRPLTIGDTESVDAAVDVMNHYHLLREDLDSITEISTWSDRRPLPAIDSKVKAAFTRTYNKNSKPLPYAISSMSKKKTATTNVQDEVLLDEEANSDENDDDIDIDKMIKAKKPSGNKKADAKDKSDKTNKTETKGKASNDKPSKRGRGRGKKN